MLSQHEPAHLWYQDAIIYELHIRSFADSNGDGFGDFPGLISKLDYLQDLGVTALWLLPFYPSPWRDDGYDIADYMSIHPAYGTLDDFDRFVAEAKSRGLHVITELVLNHTSSAHAWFQRARHAPRGSPERDFYVWSDTPDKFRDARIIFKDYESSNWTWDEVAKQYFWHRFYSHQPDLNFDNPLVHDALLEVVDFWMARGVDGMRLDAVTYLYEREGTNCESLPETHAFLKKLRHHVDERFPNRMFLAEANQWPEDSVVYFGNGDECQMTFYFPVMPRLFMSLHMEDSFPTIDIMQQTPAIPAGCQWATFLRNHDELTLEMVTDEDRDYMYRMYAEDPQARINLGIRRRLAPLLENHRGKIELMNALLLSLPGTPVLYYGDEIGMGDNIYLGDRNGCRTPMQWSAERNAGFSRANPQRLHLPVVIDPEYHFEKVNVESQQNNPHSLLWWTKRFLGLRKSFLAFGRGDITILSTDNSHVLAFLRTYQDEKLLIVANLSRFAQHAYIDLSSVPGYTPVELLGKTRFPTIAAGSYPLSMGPHCYFWFNLEAPQAAATVPSERVLPRLRVAGSWEAVLQRTSRHRLVQLFRPFLMHQTWFWGRERTIEEIEFLDALRVPMAGSAFHFCLIRVVYTIGEPETYAIPLFFASGNDAHRIEKETPHKILCRVRVEVAEPIEGILFDPENERSFADRLLDAIARQFKISTAGGVLMAHRYATFEKLLPADADRPEPRPLGKQVSHSMVVYGDIFILKGFRRVEEGVTPEVEVARHLNEYSSFTQVPTLAGFIEYRPAQGPPMSLAVLQSWMAHQESGWQYALHAVNFFYESVLTKQHAVESLPSFRMSLQDLLATEFSDAVRELLGPRLEMFRLLGQRAAEFHRALANGSSDPAFTPEPLTPHIQRSLYQSLRGDVRRGLVLLRRYRDLIPETERQAAQLAMDREEDFLRLARPIYTERIHTWLVRTHGDFHLNQLLYTGKDFVFVDLEGGGAQQPLSDRRRKRSPLHDVTAMMRSLAYVAAVGLERGGIRPEDRPSLAPWRHAWLRWVVATFLRGYFDAAASDSILPKSRVELEILFRFYALKRTAEELAQNLPTRPELIGITLDGLHLFLAE
jgi:maltose alpha-D-glucosyltransferase/alpha-amylase